MSMNVNTTTAAYANYQNNYKTGAAEKKKEVAQTTENTKSKKNTTESIAEKNLSKAAQKMLEDLRGSRNDMDFMVADFENGDNAKDLLAQSDKEYTVIFSKEEMEKMASDPKYYAEKMHSIDGALRMSDEINAQFGFERAFGKTNGGVDADTKITKFGISFNSDGTTTFFAQLEKSSASQKEYLEKLQEKKAEEKKEAKNSPSKSKYEKLQFRQIQKKKFWIRSKTLTGILSNRRKIKSAEGLIFQFSVFGADEIYANMEEYIMQITRDNYSQYAQMVQQMFGKKASSNDPLAQCDYGNFSLRFKPVDINFTKPNWDTIMTKRDKPAMSEEEFDEAIKELARKEFATGKRDDDAYRKLCMQHGETVSPDRKAIYESSMKKTGGKMNAACMFWDSKGNKTLSYNPESRNWKAISTDEEFARARVFTSIYNDELARLKEEYGEKAKGNVSYSKIKADISAEESKEKNNNEGNTIDLQI